MYSLLVGLEMSLLLIMVVLGLVAGSQASKLLYSRTGDRLRRKIRGLMASLTLLTLIGAGAAGAVVRTAFAFDPLFWLDRLLLHVPLIALPLSLAWLSSVPMLLRLLKDVRNAPRLDASVRRTISEPGLILPVQSIALGALAALYFALRPPVPFSAMAVAVPLLIVLAALILLWIRHTVRSQRAERTEAAKPPLWKRWGASLAVLAALVALAAIPVRTATQASKLPDRIDMTAAPMDFGATASGRSAGHEARAGHGGHASHADRTAGGEQAIGAVQASAAPQRSVADLTGPQSAAPDRSFTLTAEKKSVRLASGKTVEAWTYNGKIPGPELRAEEGEVVEVTLVNKDIEEGATIHWHGLDVPNAEDGVAGVTQDAVMPGQRHTYRFVADQVGTFWYHTHQHSLEGVKKGLFGALIVEPSGTNERSVRPLDMTVMTHLWEGTLAIGDSDLVNRVDAAPGTPVRLRLINTDNWVRQTYRLVGTAFRVAAIDGTDLNAPGELASGTRLVLTTGGRYDVVFDMPDRPVFLSVGGGRNRGILLSPDGKGEVPDIPADAPEFDPLHYGEPAPTPFGPDSAFDREFTMVLDNKLGVYDGRVDFLYTLNGEVFPNTPAFMVEEGELVKTTIVNRGMVDHPMHLHGHHVLVLSRNGEAADGSPWWSDTLDVLPGDCYEIAFRADNPGIWMDHCHNLAHAALGMTMHLMYAGVSTPYEAGSVSGNFPE